MQLIVGLGNPGPEYVRTRHNIGFRCVDLLAERHGLVYGRLKDGCMAASGSIAGVDVTIVKPLRYMNLSGEALAVWAVRNDLVIGLDVPVDDEEGEAPEPIVPLAVIDDIALPLGALRLRAKGSDGGHRGLESLGRVLGGDAYPRLRLGVAPVDGDVPAEEWKSYVLEVFDDREWDESEELVAHACDALEAYLENGLEWAGSRFNRKRPVSEPETAPEAEDLQSPGE